MRDYDHLISTLQKGLLYIVAGRPGMGKTAFLLTMILNAAKLDKAVALFSQEMTRDQVIYRPAGDGNRDQYDPTARRGSQRKRNMRYVEATPRIAQLPIYVTNAKR